MNKKTQKIIIISVISAIVMFMALIGITVFVTFSSIGKIQKADYYTMGEDRIPSVASVVGERKLHSVSKSTENGLITHVYGIDSDSAESDINQYKAYLVEQAGFVVTDFGQGNKSIIYAKKSVEDGKIITVTINDTAFQYEIILQKGKGSLSALE